MVPAGLLILLMAIVYLILLLRKPIGFIHRKVKEKIADRKLDKLFREYKKKKKTGKCIFPDGIKR